MNGASLLLIVILGMETIAEVLPVTVEICDAKQGATCIGKYADETDCLLYDVETKQTVLDACMTQYINQCDALTSHQWQSSVDRIIADFTTNCANVCDEAAVQLEICGTLYSGLDVLAAQIITNKVQPTATECAIALKRVYVCMINATRNCQSQEDIALTKLRAEQVAFDQCNIVIKTPTISNGTISNTTTTSKPITDTEQGSNTVLYSMLGVSSVVVLIAAVIAMYIWIRRTRNYNYIKGREEPLSTNNNVDGPVQRPEDSPYFVRDRSPMRSQQFRNQGYDGERPEAIGPFPSGSRWWTRPGFGQYGTEGVQTKPF